MFDFTPIEYISGSVMVLMSLLSVSCSSIILFIIHKIDRWNGYLILIYSMTACQIVNDIAYFLLVFYENPIVYRLISFLLSFGGLSVTLWTNVLSGILLYIVVAYTSLQIWDHYWKYFVICMVPSSSFAAVDAIYPNVDPMALAYNIFRLISIVFNFMVYAIITHKLYTMGNTATSKAVGPLRELASRFKFYPICQVITRLPAVIYQFIYGFGPASFNQPSGTVHSVALFFHALFTPSAGVAYFIVFLHMQPQGSIEFRKIRRRLYSNCCLCLHAILCCTANTSPRSGLMTYLKDGDVDDIENVDCSRPISSVATQDGQSVFSPTTLKLNGASPSNIMRVALYPSPSEAGTTNMLYKPLRSHQDSEISESDRFPERDREASGSVGDYVTHNNVMRPSEWQTYREMDEDQLSASISTSNNSLS